MIATRHAPISCISFSAYIPNYLSKKFKQYLWFVGGSGNISCILKGAPVLEYILDVLNIATRKFLVPIIFF